SGRSSTTMTSKSLIVWARSDSSSAARRELRLRVATTTETAGVITGSSSEDRDPVADRPACAGGHLDEVVQDHESDDVGAQRPEPDVVGSGKPPAQPPQALRHQ